jgi:acetyl-CoA carboxylase carboxyltransferase component
VSGMPSRTNGSAPAARDGAVPAASNGAPPPASNGAPPAATNGAPASAPVAAPLARERLELLCDPGSLQVIRSAVRSHRMGDRARAGDGVIAGTGMIAGRPVACYAQDERFAGGSLGEAQADSIVRVLRLADDARMPVIALVASGGARIQEGTAGLAGYARVFAATVALSRRVPQISVITGSCAGGGAYAPALTDFVIMTEGSAMFLTGPAVVREACGEQVSSAELGGRGVHERNGVCQLVAPSEPKGIALAQRLLSYLPQSGDDQPLQRLSVEPELGDPGAHLPERSAAAYDVRLVIRGIADAGELLELAPKWARNMVTAFACIGGRPVGIVANQPRHMGGVIDVEGCEKAARFVRTCDAYGLPLVVLVDTPGFMPGTKQEAGGIINRGAGLVEAFAAARVPRFTVVLRKAFGGAYIAMNAKDLGATLTFAWPGAQIGIMDARQAVRIVHRRDLAACTRPDQLLELLARDYSRANCVASAAAGDGFVDEVVAPAETRDRLVRALSTTSRA